MRPSAAEPATTRLPDGALPALHDRVAATASRLGAAPVHVCAHVAPLAASGGAGVACAEHPAAGILCPPCAVAHTKRHPYDVEHRCDACGAVVPTMRSVVGHASVAAFTVTTGGRRSAYIGPVLVVALGACPACFTAAGLDGVERTR